MPSAIKHQEHFADLFVSESEQLCNAHSSICWYMGCSATIHLHPPEPVGNTIQRLTAAYSGTGTRSSTALTASPVVESDDVGCSTIRCDRTGIATAFTSFGVT